LDTGGVSEDEASQHHIDFFETTAHLDVLEAAQKILEMSDDERIEFSDLSIYSNPTSNSASNSGSDSDSAGSDSDSAGSANSADSEGSADSSACNCNFNCCKGTGTNCCDVSDDCECKFIHIAQDGNSKHLVLHDSASCHKTIVTKVITVENAVSYYKRSGPC